MPFEKGHAKIGGREKGTPNKKTLIKADDLLIELDTNPIHRLIELAESCESTIDQKINCYKTIAQYTYPKLKSQDIHIEQHDYPELIKVRIIDTDGSVSIMN